MSTKRISGDKLPKDLGVHTANADELAESATQETDPLEHLKGSVVKYECPLDSVWDEYFDSDGCSEDFMKDRDQPEHPAS